MEYIICKHYYSDNQHKFLSEYRYDIFKDYRDMADKLYMEYSLLSHRNNLTYSDSNVLVYRCGTVSPLGEFKIYANPLPIYFKEIVEDLKND